MNIAKLIDKLPKLMKSSVTLGFLKNYYMDIKQICNENPKSFVSKKILKVKLIMHKVSKIFRQTLENLQQMFKIFKV